MKIAVSNRPHLMTLLALVCIFASVQSERMGLLRPTKDVVVKSRFDAGQSSYVKYTRAKHGDVKTFMTEHGAHYGLNEEHIAKQMSVKKISGGTGSFSFEHHKQTVLGYEVLGGDIVFVKDSSGNVLKSRGHPIPSSKQAAMSAPKSVGKHRVVSNLQDYIKRDKHENVEVHVTSDDMMWYRGGLEEEAQSVGEPKLVHHVQGSATRSLKGTQTSVIPGFDAYVDATNGLVLLYTEVGMAAKRQGKKMLSAAQKEELVAKKEQQQMARKKASAARKATLAQGTLKRPKSALRGTATNQFSRDMINTDNLVVKVHDCGGSSSCSFSTAPMLFDITVDDLSSASTDIKLAVYSTTELKHMVSSVSNGNIISYKGGEDSVWQIGIYLDMANAYFSSWEDGIIFGNDYYSDDILGHEWFHGYINYGPGYIYHYQSGAINEAMADIFGESLDLLNEQYLPEPETKDFRSQASSSTGADSPCLPGYGFGMPTSGDTGCRWIMGDHATAIRDMMFPECYYDPGDTFSSRYYCATDPEDYWNGWNDKGGVHYNSGVLNRVFALLVDGGVTKTGGQVQGVGIANALGLVMDVFSEGTPTDNFDDWANDLYDMCLMKANALDPLDRQYFVPDLAEGRSVRTNLDITIDHCADVNLILEESGMRRPSTEYCSNNGVLSTHLDDAQKLCAIAHNQNYYQLEYYRQIAGIKGWWCDGDIPRDDPCKTPGAWEGVVCENDPHDSTVGRVVGIIVPFKYFGYPSWPMSPEFFQFPYLKYLDVSDGYFGGRVPSAICSIGSRGGRVNIRDNGFECIAPCVQSQVFAEFSYDTSTPFCDTDDIPTDDGGGDDDRFIPTDDGGGDDDDDDMTLSECQYPAKPWKPMAVKDKVLFDWVNLAYSFQSEQMAFVAVGVKDRPLNTLDLRFKVLDEGWFDSAKTAQDRMTHIVKRAEHATLANGHLSVVADFGAIGSLVWGDEEDTKYIREIMSDMTEMFPNFFDSHHLYVLAHDLPVYIFESVNPTQFRIELWHADGLGKNKVDACVKYGPSKNRSN